MKRMLVVVLALAGAVGVVTGTGQRASAMPPFNKEFQNKYVKKDSTDPIEKQFAEKVAKVKQCNVCHEGTDKKKRNKYGQALAELITKKDVKDTKKIQEALDKVAEQHSDKDDEKSPTFGELIKQGILPAGDPE